MKTNLIALCCLFWLGSGFTSAAAYSSETEQERVVLRTSQGNLILRLYPDSAPKHVEQFLKLVRLGVYDGTFFYRVDSGFMVQVCDAKQRSLPLTPEQTQAIQPIPAEFNSRLHRRGTLSMSRWPDKPDSAETSFSIFLADAPHLDGKYTVFGTVESADEVLEAIRRVKVDNEKRPQQKIEIIKAESVQASDVPTLTASAAEQQGLAPELAVCSAALLFLSGLLTYGLSRYRLAKAVEAWGQIVALAGLLVLVTVMWQTYRQFSPMIGTALFAATIGVFMLLSRFESPK